MSADTLVPVAENIVKDASQALPQIISILWDTLSLLDDLSSSTTSIMALLTVLYKNANTTMPTEQLTVLVPRLWPLLRHKISAVRRSTVNTLFILLSKQDLKWIVPLISDVARYLFQNIVLETYNVRICC